MVAGAGGEGKGAGYAQRSGKTGSRESLRERRKGPNRSEPY